nr:acetyl-CoA hydrolase [Mycobacterium paraintracellulare]
MGAVRTLVDSNTVGAVLSDLANIGSARLVLGWPPAPVDGTDPDAFAGVVGLMPRWGVSDVLRCSAARFIPTRLSSILALLAKVLEPNVLISRLVECGGRLHFGTEVSWQRVLVESGVGVLAIIDPTSPTATTEAPLNRDRATVVGSGPGNDGPIWLLHKETKFLDGVLLLRATVPLRIDTGLPTDAVVNLDTPGLLAGVPSAGYLPGDDALYNWAEGKPVLRGVEYTHDTSRLSRGEPFVAVNTPSEIDPAGPPTTAAAARCHAELSIITISPSFDGRSPLVQRLNRPALTPAYDADVIVTESGQADLRGAD